MGDVPWYARPHLQQCFILHPLCSILCSITQSASSSFLFSVFFLGFYVLFFVSRFASYYIHCAQYCEAPSHNHCRPSPNFYAVSVCCYVLCRPLCAYHPPLKCFRSFYGVLICCRPLCGYAPTQRRHLSVTHKRLCSFHPKQARKSGS